MARATADARGGQIKQPTGGVVVIHDVDYLVPYRALARVPREM